MTDLMTTAEAALDLAVRFAIRDSYVIVAADGMTQWVADRLIAIPKWTGYLDNLGDVVIRTDESEAVSVVDQLEPTNLIVLIPKTVDRDLVGKVYGEDFLTPEGGGLLVLTEAGVLPADWPRLFVAALEVDDPDLRATNPDLPQAED